MDLIDILGGLVKRKTGGSGKGSEVLKEMRNKKAPSSPKPASPPVRSTSNESVSREALDLEDLLGVATERNTRRASSQSPSPSTNPRTSPPPTSRSAGGSATASEGSIFSGVRPGGAESPDDPVTNARARVLVLAMLNAAKCDGQISPEEEQQILKQVDTNSPETVQFLREELAKPLDVREFAWSVPAGMEEEVYTLSLITIDLDTEREAAYLRELAQGLRLAETVRDQIHRRLKAPLLKP